MTHYPQLGETSQIRVCNKKIIAAKNGKRPVQGSTAIPDQLQKITSELTVEFVVTKIEIRACLLGMQFLYNFDCILNPGKNELICGKFGKKLKLSPSKRSNKNLFLIDAEDYHLPRRCEVLIKCKIVDEEGNITHQTEIIVEPLKEFEDKSNLLIARSLNDMVDDVVWVRVLNPTLEPKKVYKNERIAFAENIEKISRTQQNNPDNNTKHRDEFDFKKHVNASSMSLSCEEKTKMRSLCTKYEVIFSRNPNYIGFCYRIYQKIKLEKDAVGTSVCTGCFSKPNGVIFAGLSYELALVYLDDVIVFGRSFDEHLKRLKVFLQRLAENGLNIMGSKGNFFSKSVSASYGTLFPRVESMSTQRK